MFTRHLGIITRHSTRRVSSKAIGKLPAVDSLHPCVQTFANELSKSQPCFRLRGNNIRVLSRPSDFLLSLMEMIRRARKRILLSSLYIGHTEKYLVDALEESLKKNSELHVHCHLDYNRSSRPGPESTVNLLKPLVNKYPDRVHVYLFKSPKLKGVMEKIAPRRFDEGWGTWHAKIYSADEELIITGANLNDSYFNDRQDRYLYFQSDTLAKYCQSFLQSMEQYCFKLRHDTEHAIEWVNANLHPQHIEADAEKTLTALQRQFMVSQAEEMNSAATDEDVLIFPIIQAGQFNIREEERCMDMLFDGLDAYAKTSNRAPLVDLTSGYFSLTKEYQSLVTKRQIDCRIVCASPLANGFYGSRGVSGRIPEGYTLLEQRFWRKVRNAGRSWQESQGGVQLQEWDREGWTYHAKGLWVSPAQNERPVLTLFGSTNLNSRSANLDTELAFVMLTPVSKNEDVMRLREDLDAEIKALRTYAVPWRGEKRKVRIGTKALVALVGGML